MGFILPTANNSTHFWTVLMLCIHSLTFLKCLSWRYESNKEQFSILNVFKQYLSWKVKIFLCLHNLLYSQITAWYKLSCPLFAVHPQHAKLNSNQLICTLFHGLIPNTTVARLFAHTNAFPCLKMMGHPLEHWRFLIYKCAVKVLAFVKIICPTTVATSLFLAILWVPSLHSMHSVFVFVLLVCHM